MIRLGDSALRESLDQKDTQELLSVLMTADDSEWVPEAFPIIEQILLSRGVDIDAAMKRMEMIRLGDSALRESLDQKDTQELLSVLMTADDSERVPEAFPIIEQILLSRGVDIDAAMKRIESETHTVAATCRECGSPYPNGVERCPQCEPLECIQCHKHIAADSGYCYHCGAGLSAPAATPPATHQEPQSVPAPPSLGTPQGRIIAGIALSVLGVLLLILRDDISISLVGREAVLREAFLSGESLRQARVGLIAVSTVTLVGGAIAFTSGILKLLERRS